ncbi:hypothetical protein [Devosia naphthalenivorans]|jgi:hypothetical protein|uniref:hypothetical protein n=1 Tax=Devosia naphthalenivorans TaxID=2082392 RepID=UPI000D382DA3|nr:hypothetical protein [Devosia naphthalenivorans]
MSATEGKYTGLWLHHGDWEGKEFSHELAEYHHDEHPGAVGATEMRHAVVEHDGAEIAVWVPAHWSDEQARQALESNLW